MGKGIRDLFSKKGEEALQKILGCDERAPLQDEPRLHETGQAVVLISVLDINPNPFQPRTLFDEEKLACLSESLKDRGMLQPVLLRQVMTPSSHKYELVAGERRLRAAKMAGLTDIPAVVKKLDDKDMRVLTLVENLQREDLNVVEKTLSIGSLQKTIGDTTAVAKSLALSKRSIERYVRIYLAIGTSEPLLSIIKRDAHLIDFKDADALADIVPNLEQEALGRFVDAINNDGIKRAITNFRNSLRAKPGRKARSQSLIGAVRETATHICLQVRYEKWVELKYEDRNRLRIMYEDFAARIEKSKNTEP